jgi:AraC-like DNA-binding protein
MATAKALAEVLKGMDFGNSRPVQSVQDNILNIEQVKENRKKPSKALTQAVEWIKQNDPNHQMQIRDIATLAGVSIGTAHTARKSLQGD